MFVYFSIHHHTGKKLYVGTGLLLCSHSPRWMHQLGESIETDKSYSKLISHGYTIFNK